MKNWEKYEKEIKEVGLDAFAMLKKSGEIAECAAIGCSECRFCIPGEKCGVVVARWLYEDYEEPNPKLTIAEMIIVQAFYENNYYIARDKDGLLWIYDFKPVQYNSEWDSEDDSTLRLDGKLFPFITWESGKAWSIEELRELEVKE